MEITETEKRILRNLQLRGCIGHCGSYTAKQREALLLGLLEKKLIDKNCNLTPLGIKLSSPYAYNN